MTGILLWLSFVAIHPRKWQWSCLYLAILFMVLFGLRLIVNAEPSPYSIAYTWQLNTTDWRLRGAMVYIGLLIPLFVALYINMQRAWGYRCAFILLPYLALYALFGVWQETRLLMPLLIFGVPFLPSAEQEKAVL